MVAGLGVCLCAAAWDQAAAHGFPPADRLTTASGLCRVCRNANTCFITNTAMLRGMMSLSYSINGKCANGGDRHPQRVSIVVCAVIDVDQI